MIATTHTERAADEAESRYRAVFRRLHAGHDDCAGDEWLRRTCRRDGAAVAPVVWSRRNGPWRRVALLLVGAAPGNAGGRGTGDMGAHGTRIPFGGDIAGANLDLLLRSVGLSRDEVFITAALNRLPDAGGGEPSTAELARPAGDYGDSLAPLRDTILASGARLVVALGNVAVRACVAAASAPWRDVSGRLRLPGLRRLRSAGLHRGEAAPWPVGGSSGLPAVDPDFGSAWRRAWNAPLPRLLWLLHPSAQNMSPHAGTDTAFHRRMLETVTALRAAVTEEGLDAGSALPPGADHGFRAPAGAHPRRGPDAQSVYRTVEWRERVGPRHAALLELWHAKGL